MNINSQHQSILTMNFPAADTAPREQAVEIAVEMPVTNSSAPDAATAVIPPGRWLLTNQPGVDPKTRLHEPAPEPEHCDLSPGSTGHDAPAAASPEEDDGGRSANKQPVAEDAADAQRDHLLQAGKEKIK